MEIVIVNKSEARVFYSDGRVLRLTTDRDVRELIYWLLDIHMRLVNDDITQEIVIERREVA